MLTETAKSVWGSSTKALEAARVDAPSRSFLCDLEACMDVVVGLTVEDLTQDPPRMKTFSLFSQNRRKGIIVLMDVPGMINTTEVGVFFDPLSDGDGVKIDVSSRSTHAEQSASDILFAELESRFSVIE
jgi:hypothetical protein